MSHERRDSSGQRRRILVIANETVAAVALHQAIGFRAHNVAAEVLVVVPVLGSGLRHRAPGADTGRAAAEDRLRRSVKRLRGAGIAVRGQLGDADPLRAIADALDVFAADEIVVATRPAARSEWVARDVVGSARARFARPVLHVVVDRDKPSAPVAGGGQGLPSRPSEPTLSAG